MSVPPTFGQKLRPMDVILRDHRPLIIPAYFIAYENDTERIEENYDEALWLSDYLPYMDSIEEVMQPMSDLFYPIIADSNRKIELMDGTYRTEDHEVVGFLCLALYWKDMLNEILPDGSIGILVSTKGNEIVPSESLVSNQLLILEFLWSC